MYSVIIVDDDRLVLDEVSNLLDWETYGFSIQATKSNGMRALEFIKKSPPNVIITDIKMPAMDGIELLKNVKSLYPNIVVIMMSSYSEFSYAKEAITNGCFDYILKDELNSTTLAALLKKISLHLNSVDSTNSSSLEKRLKDLFLNPSLGKDVLNLSTDNESQKYYYLKCDIDMPYPLIYRKSDHIQLHLEFSLHEAEQLKAITNTDFRICHIIELSGHSFIVELEDLTGAYYPLQQLTSLSRQLQSVYFDRFKKSFSVFYCPKKLFPWEAAALFSDPSINTLNRFFLGTSLFLDINDPVLQVQRTDKILDYDALDYLLSQNDLNGLLQVIDAWLSEIEAAHDIFGLEQLIDGCFFLVSKYQQKNNIVHVFPETNPENCLTLAGIRLWIHQLFNLYFEKVNVNMGISPEIRSAIDYINENIGNKDLKIQTVADYVGLSYTWFSSLFKKETGQTFNNYLLNARVDYAKYLLDNKACKIYEVAEFAGFGNSQYFSKVFKKYVGYTPTDYYKK